MTKALTLIPTRVTVFSPIGTETSLVFDLERDPGLDKIHEIVDPHLLPKADFEHVSVLFGGQPCDMFVDEMGHMKGLVRNEKATEIYRAFWLKQHPETLPDSLDWIVGPAILFHRRVWF